MDTTLKISSLLFPSEIWDNIFCMQPSRSSLEKKSPTPLPWGQAVVNIFARYLVYLRRQDRRQYALGIASGLNFTGRSLASDLWGRLTHRDESFVALGGLLASSKAIQRGQLQYLLILSPPKRSESQHLQNQHDEDLNSRRGHDNSSK